MLKIVIVIILLIFGYFVFINFSLESLTKLLFPTTNHSSPVEKIQQTVQNLVPSPPPKITLETPPQSKILPTDYHIFQSFNNCGPAALSMALRFYSINISQQELGQALRPYQIAGGDNDDKSVTLEELAEKSKEYNFVPFHRPNGNIELIKQFITYDMPVITRTWLKENEDIGHYRVVKGYEGNIIIQDDSLQGKNLKYTTEEFDKIWGKFNYEYLVLVPKEKVEIAETILGEDKDPKIAWGNAVKLSLKKLEENPNDIDARFNLSVAYYNIGDYQKSVEEFEKVESRLSFRTLWYQIEPIEAYFQLGNYQRVFQITEKVLNYHNRAYSEAYLLRGNSYLKQNNPQAARAEFEKAVLYNKNLKSAQEALSSL